MSYDRARRPGEDVVEYGVETQRLAASVAPGWRAMVREGLTTEAFIEGLASPLKPAPGWRPPPRWTPTATPVAASSGGSPQMLPGPTVNAEANPLVYQMATDQPQAYQDALTASGGRVPCLFGSSDLPAATASGMDPSRLAAAHWAARPAIAAAADLAEAEELLSMASGPNGDAVLAMPEIAGHHGVQDYAAAVQEFGMAGVGAMRRRQDDAQIAAARQVRDQVAAAAGAEPSPDDDYEALFGHLDRQAAARRQAVEDSIAAGRAVGHGRGPRREHP